MRALDARALCYHARMKAVAIVLAAWALAACSAFVPHLQSPHLSVVNVELLSSSLWEQQLTFYLGDKWTTPMPLALSWNSPCTRGSVTAGERFGAVAAAT